MISRRIAAHRLLNRIARMSTRPFKLTSCWLLLCLVPLLESGCAYWSPLDDYLDDRAYKKDVDRYKSHGFDDKTAQRKAYENEFFRKMEENK